MRTILIVEDEAPLRELLADLVEDAGYRPLQAIHGREALALIEQERPDVVLSDVMMPVLNGAELCRILKAQPSSASIPVTDERGRAGDRRWSGRGCLRRQAVRAERTGGAGSPLAPARAPPRVARTPCPRHGSALGRGGQFYRPGYTTSPPVVQPAVTRRTERLPIHLPCESIGRDPPRRSSSGRHGRCGRPASNAATPAILLAHISQFLLIRAASAILAHPRAPPFPAAPVRGLSQPLRDWPTC